MYADDSRRPWRNHAPDSGRIQVVRRGVDVGKYRCDLLPLQRVRGRDECEGRDDDLALEVERARGDFERDGAVTHGHAMLDSEEFSNPMLELLRSWTVVGKPAAIEDVGCALQK